MPTYKPVPLFFASMDHRSQARYLYKNLLKQSAEFFDERASQWMMDRTRTGFRKMRYSEDSKRIHKKMSDARKALRMIERANRIDQKEVARILRSAYGLKGRERRKLLQPILKLDALQPHQYPVSETVASTSTLLSDLKDDTANESISLRRIASGLRRPKLTPPEERLIAAYPRSRPPAYSVPIQSLLATTGKPIYPKELPVPLFKPLHLKREANLRWRYFTKLLKQTKPPLPDEIRLEMERKAQVGLGVLDQKKWGLWEKGIVEMVQSWHQRGLQQKREMEEQATIIQSRWVPTLGGKPAAASTMTLRLYRRMWQKLLMDVPVMTRKFNPAASRVGLFELNDYKGDDPLGEGDDDDPWREKRHTEPSSKQKTQPKWSEWSTRIPKPVKEYDISTSSAALRNPQERVSGPKATLTDMDRLGMTDEEIAKLASRYKK